MPGSDSTRATDLLDDQAPEPRQRDGADRAARSARPPRRRAANQTAVKKTVQAYQDDSRVRRVTSPLSDQGADQLTKDGKIAYISLNLRDGPAELDEEEADSLIAVADPARAPGSTSPPAPTSARRSRSRRPSRAR